MGALDAVGAVAKQLTAVFAALTAAGYAAGYLVLRARAHALGTDPGFPLLDETYVFAGVRFALSTALLLLVVAWPSLRIARALPDNVYPILGLAFVTVAGLALMASGDGVLIDGNRHAWVTDAIVGRNGWGIAVMLAATTTATIALILAQRRIVAKGATGTLTFALGLVAMLQIVLLPILHGMFFADRKAWELARLPAGVTGVELPVWIVARTKDRAVLFARSGPGQSQLIPIKADALDTVPVKRVVNLALMIEAPVIRAQPTSNIAVAAVLAAATPVATAGGWLDAVVQFSGAILSSLGSLGESGVRSGELWIYSVATGARQRLGAETGLAWPIIAADGSLRALQGSQVVELDRAGRITRARGEPADWVKLVAAAPDGQVFGFVGRDRAQPAMLSPEGPLTVLKDRLAGDNGTQVKALLHEDRSFAHGMVQIRPAVRGIRGHDVFLLNGQERQISDCGDDECGHPFVSPDGTTVVFVREPRAGP